MKKKVFLMTIIFSVLVSFEMLAQNLSPHYRDDGLIDFRNEQGKVVIGPNEAP